MICILFFHLYTTVWISGGSRVQRNVHVLNPYISHTHLQTTVLTERKNKNHKTSKIISQSISVQQIFFFLLCYLQYR